MSAGDVGPVELEAWHGTRRLFSAFDPDRSETEYGCFFADTPEAAALYANGPGGRVVRVSISFENPFRCTAEQWSSGDCPDPREVARVGVHDGYVVDGLDGTTLIAWREESVRVLGDDYVHGTEGFASLMRRAVELGYVEAEEVEDLAATGSVPVP